MNPTPSFFGAARLPGCTVPLSLLFAAAAHAAAPSGNFSISDLGLELVHIAPGTFQMGTAAEGGADERPVTEVTLTRAYWLGKTEVTQAQWRAVMHASPAYFQGNDHPVERVSWHEALEFCRRLTERERAAGRLPAGHVFTLPTEAQWEFACRAGTTGPHAGDVANMAWINTNSGGRTHPVAQKQPNAWGLHDMHGNVWEWCLDRYGNYPGGRVSDPTGAEAGAGRVYRGGRWGNSANFARAAYRLSALPEHRGVSLGLRVALVAADSAESPTAARPTALPFGVTVSARTLQQLSADLDYPVRQVVIDGEVWMIFVPGRQAYKGIAPVLRYKGPDLEHLERQPDGTGDFSGGSAHLGCGMWWDKETRTLYGLLHTEYDLDHPPGQGWTAKKTRLAISRDLGLTWTLVGDILTRALPETKDYVGDNFEAGPADFDFYVDERGGYFYVTSWNSFVPKNGPINGFLMFSEVARCAIADKMAPGKWFKFRDGQWAEPGLGGKASRVGMDRRGLYGNTIYSEHLGLYLRIGINIGVTDDRGMPPMGFRDHSIYVSVCTDLARQDWSPAAKLLDDPDNTLFGFTLTDAEGRAGESVGRKLRVYNYWLGGSRVLDVTLDRDGRIPVVEFPPHGAYDYLPNPASGDRLESRVTMILGADDPGVKYRGNGWFTEEHKHYYQGRARVTAVADQEIEHEFHGTEIYWRAVFAPDAGKADIYLDGVYQETVDLHFAETAIPYQFAYVRTDLDPSVAHTIKIVTRGGYVRHLAFEQARF